MPSELLRAVYDNDLNKVRQIIARGNFNRDEVGPFQWFDNWNKNTPVHYAVINNNPEMLRLLLENKFTMSKKNIKDNGDIGDFPIEMAYRAKCWACLDVFAQFNAYSVVNSVYQIAMVKAFSAGKRDLARNLWTATVTNKDGCITDGEWRCIADFADSACTNNSAANYRRAVLSALHHPQKYDVAMKLLSKITQNYFIGPDAGAIIDRIITLHYANNNDAAVSDKVRQMLNIINKLQWTNLSCDTALSLMRQHNDAEMIEQALAKSVKLNRAVVLEDARQFRWDWIERWTNIHDTYAPTKTIFGEIVNITINGRQPKEKIELLLQRGADISVVSKNNHETITREGITVNANLSFDYPAITLAAFKQQWDVVWAILDHNIQGGDATSYGYATLIAAFAQKFTLARELIQSAADVLDVNAEFGLDKLSLLYVALKHYDYEQELFNNLLANQNINLNKSVAIDKGNNDQPIYAIQYAFSCSNRSACIELLNKGAKAFPIANDFLINDAKVQRWPDIQNFITTAINNNLHTGEAAAAYQQVLTKLLQYAVEQKNVRVAEALIELGARIDVENEQQKTPVRDVVDRGYWDVVAAIVTKRACGKVDKVDYAYALLHATKRNDARLTNLLLEQGAPLDCSIKVDDNEVIAGIDGKPIVQAIAAKYHGYTPLHCVVEFSDAQQLLEDMLSRATNSALQYHNNNGQTPLLLAIKLGKSEFVGQLLTDRPNLSSVRMDSKACDYLLKRLRAKPQLTWDCLQAILNVEPNFDGTSKFDFYRKAIKAAIAQKNIKMVNILKTKCLENLPADYVTVDPCGMLEAAKQNNWEIVEQAFVSKQQQQQKFIEQYKNAMNASQAHAHSDFALLLVLAITARQNNIAKSLMQLFTNNIAVTHNKLNPIQVRNIGFSTSKITYDPLQIAIASENLEFVKFYLSQVKISDEIKHNPKNAYMSIAITTEDLDGIKTLAKEGFIADSDQIVKVSNTTTGWNCVVEYFNNVINIKSELHQQCLAKLLVAADSNNIIDHNFVLRKIVANLLQPELDKISTKLTETEYARAELEDAQKQLELDKQQLLDDQQQLATKHKQIESKLKSATD